MPVEPPEVNGLLPGRGPAGRPPGRGPDPGRRGAGHPDGRRGATVTAVATTLTLSTLAGTGRTGATGLGGTGTGTRTRTGCRGGRGGLGSGSGRSRGRRRELGRGRGRSRGTRSRLRAGRRTLPGGRGHRGGGSGLPRGGRLGSRRARGSRPCGLRRRRGRTGRRGLRGRGLAGGGLAAATALLEGVSQLAYNRRLDRRGRRTDKFTEFLELGHDDLALHPELLGEFVYPDLSHFAPFRSGLRRTVATSWAYSSRAHRVLIAISTYFQLAGVPGPHGVPYGTFYGVTCSTRWRSASVSNGPGALNALWNARRRTARSRQTRAGCTYAPRPGSVPR